MGLSCVDCIRHGINGKPAIAVYNGKTVCKYCLTIAIAKERSGKVGKARSQQ